MSVIETIIDIPAGHIGNVFGQFDLFAKKIEKKLKKSDKLSDFMKNVCMLK